VKKEAAAMEDYKFNIDKCSNIEVPESIDYVIKNSIARAQSKKKKTVIKYISTVAAGFVIFIVCINISPVFASSVSKVPGLEYLVKLVMFDKGLENAVQNGFVQYINRSAEDKDIKLTVKDVIIDKKNMIIGYEIETANKGYKDLNITFGADPIKITDDKGNKLIGGMSLDPSPDEKFKKTGKKEGILNIRFDNVSKVPENMILKVTQMRNDNKNEINGDWTIKFSIDAGRANMEPYHYPINKNIGIGQLNVLMKEVNIYPTCGEIKLNLSSNKEYKFVDFINARLVDDRGVEYKTTGGWGFVDNMDRTLLCESTYFIKSKTLNFKADGAFFIPKKDMYVLVDLKNKKVIEDCGYNLEYLNDGFENIDGKRNYILEFKVKDKDLIKADKLAGSYIGGIGFGDITDEKNHKYKQVGIFSSSAVTDMKSSEKYLQSGIVIYDITSQPELLKLKVQYANKGVLQPINIKIK
jgi:hypothetical protein